jgi:aminoglycoside/choline kinase family phosphotransferase
MTEPLEAAGEDSGLEAWLAGYGLRLREIDRLPGDVSLRRYARLELDDLDGGSTAILALYPPEVRATCPRFLRTTELLAGAGVRVPRVLGAACASGWMLLEDLGPQTLGDWRDRPWDELAPYFGDALEAAGRIARLPAESVAELNPPLGRELLAKELAQTWNLYLEPHGLTGGPALTAALRAALDEICANLAADPPVPCHRDFMARNLMPLPPTPPLPNAGVAVLDHQDLRLGPPAYDLASLLNDTVFPPAAAEEALLAVAAPSPEDRLRYHRAAAQRTLKAVGTYTAFSLRGADRHLPLVGPTLARGLAHLERVPEGAPLAAELRRVWCGVLPH